MDLKDERNMILDMVAEGRINVEEAKQLLDALEKSARAREEKDEEFFSTPGMDFHIPEVRIPNISRIVNRAYRHAMPKVYSNLADLDDIRDDLEDEMERLREELEALKEDARRMKGDARHQEEDVRHRHDEEDWDK